MTDVHYNVQITIQQVTNNPTPPASTTRSYSGNNVVDKAPKDREIVQLAAINVTDKVLTHLITKAKGHLDLVID